MACSGLQMGDAQFFLIKGGAILLALTLRAVVQRYFARSAARRMSRYPQVDFGHTPYDAAFGRGDVYDIGPKAARSGKRPLTVAIAGCGGVAQAKWIPADPPAADDRRAAGDRRGCRPGSRATGTRPPPCPPRRLLPGWRRCSPLCGPTSCWCSRRMPYTCRSRARRSRPASPASSKSRSRGAATRRPRLVRFAESKKVLLAAVANKRFSPPYALAKALCDSGALKAEPAVFTGKFTLGYPYVDLLEAGTVHLLDLVLWFMGPVAQRACPRHLRRRPADKRRDLVRLPLRRDRNRHDQRRSTQLCAVGARRDLRAQRLPRRRQPARTDAA